MQNDTKYLVRIFLIVAPVVWAFHLVLKHNAQIDAVFMLIFSLIIYKYPAND